LGSPQLYERLDMLYQEILKSAFGKFRADPVRMDNVRRVLTWLTLDEYVVVSARNLQLVGIPPSVTMDVVERLRSVLVKSAGSGDIGDVDLDTNVKPCHASFPQFLLNNSRCTDRAFWIEAAPGHGLIAHSFLELVGGPYVETLRESAVDDQPWMWKHANANLMDQVVKACRTDELCRSLRAFADTHLGSWARGQPPWHDFRSSNWNPRYQDRLDDVVKVRAWCEGHDVSDAHLRDLLEEFVAKRSTELEELAAQDREEEAAREEEERKRMKEEEKNKPEAAGIEELGQIDSIPRLEPYTS